jgi:hypothetical protein
MSVTNPSQNGHVLPDTHGQSHIKSRKAHRKNAGGAASGFFSRATDSAPPIFD